MAFARNIAQVLEGNRNLQILTLQAVVTQFCFGMFYVFWQPYMVGLGTSFTQLGTIQTVITVFTGVGSLFGGKLSDLYGRKPVHIGSMITRIIAVLFAYTASDWIGFLGFGVFIGLSASWTQTNPVTTTLVSESVEEGKMNTAMSLYFSAATLAAVVASPIGGYLAANEGYYLIFVSCILGELFNVVLAQTLLSETFDNSGEALDDVIDLRSLLVPERDLLPFYLMSILTMFSWRVTFSNLNAILVDSYGLSTVQLGFMASAFSLTWGLTQAPVGTLIDKYPKKQFLLISRLGFLVIALGYIVSSSFTVFLMLQVVNGLAHSFSVTTFNSMVLTQTRRERRATVMAKLATLPQVVSVPAPIIGGYLYDRYGFTHLLYIRVVFMIATILIVLWWIKPVTGDMKQENQM